MRTSARKGRGSAVVEFAIGFSLLLAGFGGVYQFGHTFYLYNTLESSVRNGARYASLSAYDAPDGATFKDRIRRMVVYGNPTAPTGSTPVVMGLNTTHVRVTEVKSGIMPDRVTVELTGFTIDAIFADYTMNGKPAVTFDYMGQLLVP